MNCGLDGERLTDVDLRGPRDVDARDVSDIVQRGDREVSLVASVDAHAQRNATQADGNRACDPLRTNLLQRDEQRAEIGGGERGGDRFVDVRVGLADRARNLRENFADVVVPRVEVVQKCPRGDDGDRRDDDDRRREREVPAGGARLGEEHEAHAREQCARDPPKRRNRAGRQMRLVDRDAEDADRALEMARHVSRILPFRHRAPAIELPAIAAMAPSVHVPAYPTEMHASLELEPHPAAAVAPKRRRPQGEGRVCSPPAVPMSDDSRSKKKRDWTFLIPVVSVGGPIVAVLGGAFYEEVLPHFHGATPQELASVQLGSPKQVGHDLPMTSVEHGHEVEVKLRSGACHPYEKAEFDWAKKTLDAPESMHLHAEHEHESTNGATVTAALRRHIHGFRGTHTWGPVSVTVSGDYGDISFTVNHYLSSGARNPLFERQLEAARELVLNAALNVPMKVSDKELADVLGTGYPTAQLAQLDPGTSVESAPTVLHQLFPGAVPYGSGAWNVARRSSARLVDRAQLDEPAWRAPVLVQLHGHRLVPGESRRPFVVPRETARPADGPRDGLRGRQEGLLVRDRLDGARLGRSGIDARSTSDTMNAADFARLFRALDACRESNESTGGGHGDTR